MIEAKILVSLLRLTRQGPFRKELLGKNSRVPMQLVSETLRKLCRDGFCKQKGDVVEVSPAQRVKIAVRAIQFGADFEQVCTFLQWKEFENLAAEAFEANNYSVTNNFRFKHTGKRWEIDLIAYKEPIIVCVDCKHWHHGWSRTSIVKAVEMQTKRTKALADTFSAVNEKIGLEIHNHVLLIPTVLSLTQGPFKFHNKVPIVPILQIQNFLNELPAYTRLLTHFLIKIKSERHKLTKCLK